MSEAAIRRLAEAWQADADLSYTRGYTAAGDSAGCTYTGGAGCYYG